MIDYIASIIPELVNVMPCAFGEFQAIQNIGERQQATFIKSNCSNLCSSVDFAKHCDVGQRQGTSKPCQNKIWLLDLLRYDFRLITEDSDMYNIFFYIGTYSFYVYKHTVGDTTSLGTQETPGIWKIFTKS